MRFCCSDTPQRGTGVEAGGSTERHWGAPAVRPRTQRGGRGGTYGEVSPGGEPLGEVVEGVGPGAHGVAVPVDLVEQVRGLVQPVVADVHILLPHAFGSPCGPEHW